MSNIEKKDESINTLIENIVDKDVLKGFKEILQKYNNGTEKEKEIIADCLSSGLARGCDQYTCETEGHNYSFWEEVFKDDPAKGPYNSVQLWRKTCNRCGAQLSSYVMPKEVRDLSIQRYTLSKNERDDM